MYEWIKFRHAANKRIVDIDEEMVTLLGAKALSIDNTIEEIGRLELEREFLKSVVDRVN